MINVIKTDIEGVVIIEPRVFGDERGYFMETWSQRDFDIIASPTHSDLVVPAGSVLLVASYVCSAAMSRNCAARVIV